jgi:iron-sulfur cluster repair protein YtfE (RIC family)
MCVCFEKQNTAIIQIKGASGIHPRTYTLSFCCGVQPTLVRERGAEESNGIYIYDLILKGMHMYPPIIFYRAFVPEFSPYLF